jgi:urease accessory protein
MTRHFRAFALAVLAVSTLASPAMAHTFGAWGAGFPQGFLHPMLGFDHILAMVGVGFWAGQLGGRAMWLVPLSFVTAMILGGALGLGGLTLGGFNLPAVEMGIGGSVVLLGLLIALRTRVALRYSMASVAAFAIFHGFAHGAEAPEAADPVMYCVGFIMATALLHAIGIGLSGISSRLLPSGADRVVGGLTGLLGLGLMFGV